MLAAYIIDSFPHVHGRERPCPPLPIAKQHRHVRRAQYLHTRMLRHAHVLCDTLTYRTSQTIPRRKAAPGNSGALIRERHRVADALQEAPHLLEL